MKLTQRVALGLAFLVAFAAGVTGCGTGSVDREARCYALREAGATLRPGACPPVDHGPLVPGASRTGWTLVPST